VVIADNSARDDRLFGLDLSGVACEMSHGFGLNDSARESANERTDPWDLMSVYAPNIGLGLLQNLPFAEHAFFAGPDGNSVLATPPLPFQRQGPGLSAANMHIMGWLDDSRVITPGVADSVVLRPLHRRDLSGHLAAQIGPFYVEFRMNERWDLGIPEPCVLIHDIGGRPGSGTPRSELVAAHKNPTSKRIEMLQGDIFEVGDALDIFRPHLRITVDEINPSERFARLSVLNRAGRQPHSGTLFGGVEAGGSGFIWTPGGGFKRIPPESPLRRILEISASAQSLVEVPTGEPEEGALRRRQVVGDLLGLMEEQVNAAAHALSPQRQLPSAG
jgi:hypothetical protein